MKHIWTTIKPRLGWTAIIILSAIPVLIWATMKPMNQRFGSMYGLFTSTGQLLSLIGTPLFALSLIMSGRFGWMEDFFGGMNRVYIVHHIIGGISFILLMMHPLALSVTYAVVSFNVAALFFIPTQTSLAVDFGIYSLLSLMLLLILTYYVTLKYHIWKWTHKALGVALFLGVIHSLLIESDISQNDMLKYYLLGLCAIALLVYMYRTVFGRWLVRKYSYKVNYVAHLTKNSWKIEMQPDSKKVMPYRSGQFIFIQFVAPGVSGEWHPFSISSASQEGVLDIIIKTEGDYTKVLGSIKPGMKARIEGAYGRFLPSKPVSRQIWIAGGIGVTPFLSMAKALTPDSAPVDLYYVVRGMTEAVGQPRLGQIADKIDGFRVCMYDTTVEKERLSAKTVAQMSGDLKNTDIYICGPPAMMKSMRKQFVALKVPNGRIHTEEFSMS